MVSLCGSFVGGVVVETAARSSGNGSNLLRSFSVQKKIESDLNV